MNYLLKIVVFSIAITIKGYAQFSPLVVTPNKDRIGYAFEKDNNLYLTYKNFNDKTNSFLNKYDGNISYIVKYNLENKQVDTIKLKSTISNIKEFNFNILSYNDTLFAFYSSQQHPQFRKLHFLKLYNNEIIADIPLNLNNDSLEFNYSTIINHKNNLIVLASHIHTTNGYILYELDLNGNIIKELNIDIGFMSNIEQLKDSSYIISNQLWGYAKVDKNLDSLNMIYIPSIDIISETPIVSDSFFLLAGRHSVLNITTPDYDGEFLYRINPYTEQIDTLYQDTLYSGINHSVRNSVKGLDSKYKNHIYMSNNIDNCPLFWSYIDCKSFITLYSFKENGAIRWSKLLGGDASYSSWQIVALADSGVFLYANRYSPIDNPNQEEDVYYVKFDKDGNIDNDFYNPITGIKQHKIPLIDFLIYPNPNNGFFNIISSDVNKDYKIKIFSIQGQQIIEKNITTKDVIDLRKQSNGIYFYHIEYLNQIIETGKIEKRK